MYLVVVTEQRKNVARSSSDNKNSCVEVSVMGYQCVARFYGSELISPCAWQSCKCLMLILQSFCFFLNERFELMATTGLLASDQAADLYRRAVKRKYYCHLIDVHIYYNSLFETSIASLITLKKICSSALNLLD